ncbi:hypothetical protein J3R82DRAFT_8913 [Butyriboletus roseoflavus]|nr:hypothetical protein J3R82DRAFT_8913 [Butyriboletus roseoflavus]
MPFSLHYKIHPHAALEMFTGRAITAENIRALINAPENALLLQRDAHEQYDILYWGIEAVLGSGGVRYFSRPVREEHLSRSMKCRMNKELYFGTNVLNEDRPIGLPDPCFCNTMLAITWVLHMSGGADVLDELREDDECSREGGSGMGISDAYDNLFVVKLHVVALSRVMVE